jgi:oxygen-independent coproporphyrinogen-3 oxidase
MTRRARVRVAVPSVYVHFPWCLAKCPYCDFVSYATERDDIDHVGYADAILREAEGRSRQLAGRGGFAGGRPAQSIFFGGGTPSLWSPAELGRVLARLRALFAPGGTPLEVTVECNPTSLDRDRARALVDVGVDRLSIGTQSLRADQLRFLGRLHDPDGARRAIEAALAAGVPRVSTDLIFGLPDQSPEDAATQARDLAGFGLRHLSCYQLTIEPGTQFGERKKRGLLPMADDAVVADAFLAVDAALEGDGLRHYEISNFAAPGEEARHNMAYWTGEEYLGLGCGAFGFVRTPVLEGADGGARGLRYRNQVEPRRYVDGTRALAAGAALGEGDGLTLSDEALSTTELLRERIMLGLRLASGIDLGAAGRELGTDPFTPERTRALGALAQRGRIVREGDVVRVPREAWLFTDDTAARLF